MVVSVSTYVSKHLPASRTSQVFPAQQQTTEALSLVGFPHVAHSLQTEEMARLGVHAVFRLKASRITQETLHQLERRDRAVLLLQDGRRTIQDVSRLLNRTEVEVARTMVRFLKQGYVEYGETSR